MRTIYYSISIGFVLMAMASCKKSAFTSPPSASLTVTNAVVGGTSIRLGSNAKVIANNDFAQLTVNAGYNEVYIWPVTDSTQPYYIHNKWLAEDRGAYSLFVTGAPTAVDGILVKENIPYRTDSTAGIRFINLSPNSPALNITLSSTPTVNEVSDLEYKEMTGFTSYPALYNSAYTFQVRNAATNAVLATYSFSAASLPRCANVTLVIRGLVGNSPAINITRVNNDR